MLKRGDDFLEILKSAPKIICMHVRKFKKVQQHTKIRSQDINSFSYFSARKKGQDYLHEIWAKRIIVKGVCEKFEEVPHRAQEQIAQSLLCISTTSSNDLERSDTKLEVPSFPCKFIKYSVLHSTQNLI